MIFRTSIGLDVHTRSIAAAAFVPETGEVEQAAIGLVLPDLVRHEGRELGGVGPGCPDSAASIRKEAPLARTCSAVSLVVRKSAGVVEQSLVEHERLAGGVPAREPPLAAGACAHARNVLPAPVGHGQDVPAQLVELPSIFVLVRIGA